MPLPSAPYRLLEEFKNHIEELKQLDERIQRRVEKLEQQCHREAKEFARKVQDLQRSNQVSAGHVTQAEPSFSGPDSAMHFRDRSPSPNTKVPVIEEYICIGNSMSCTMDFKSFEIKPASDLELHRMSISLSIHLS